MCACLVAAVVSILDFTVKEALQQLTFEVDQKRFFFKLSLRDE